MKVTEIHQGAVLLRCPTEHVAVVTLNRPEARNAVNAELAQSLDAVVKALEADPQIRAVVLTGQGDRA
ncbi:MAG: enoyl-CoA hydratase, partial [Betaproteobacteria bacterium]|nr:enoyl-CoA hydratase [Betaproteobacteria bacterium]